MADDNNDSCKRVKVDHTDTTDNEAKVIQADSTRKNDILHDYYWRLSENVAYELRPMARQEDFQEEEYIRFHSNIITSMVRLLQAPHPMPIDILRIMFTTTEGLQDPDSFTQQPPYMVFKGLSTRELEQLRDDVKFDLDYITRVDSTTGIMRQCWEAILAVCEGELAQSKIMESGDLKAIEEHDRATRNLQSLSYSELQLHQWELDSQIPLFCLTAMSTENQHLNQLIQFMKAKIFLKENHGCHILGYRLMSEDKVPFGHRSKVVGPLLEMDDELQKRVIHLEENTTSCLKTRLARFGIHDEEEYEKFMDRASIAMKAAGRSFTDEDKDYEMTPISYPSVLEYEWSDKYLPIKPMQSSRVEYGPQLNSYNDYHKGDGGKPYYAHVVKAYKFNIFYPDIVDKRKLQFFVEYNKHNPHKCLLTFRAGPPYQDVGFHIINEEWDLNSFKSSFKEGILHFYFDLKGYFYRH